MSCRTVGGSQLNGIQEVVGSIPIGSTKENKAVPANSRHRRTRFLDRAPRSGVGAVGKWPAGATAKSLAQAGHLSTAVVIADLDRRHYRTPRTFIVDAVQPIARSPMRRCSPNGRGSAPMWPEHR
jgi:hypothetical protein